MSRNQGRREAVRAEHTAIGKVYVAPFLLRSRRAMVIKRKMGVGQE